MVSDEHPEEVSRLWEAHHRDFPAVILYMAGGQQHERAAERWLGTYLRLTDLGQLPDHLHLDDPGTDHIGGRLLEMVGLIRIGRDANADAAAETLGEFIDLGEQEIRRQVDQDTSGP